jgi:hypothetical protein
MFVEFGTTPGLGDETGINHHAESPSISSPSTYEVSIGKDEASKVTFRKGGGW